MSDIFSLVLKILFFFVVGSLISFIADSTGKKIGKKKIVLFNIRPRYTAMFITSVTGGIIAVGSMILLSFLSQDARIYLFQMNKIIKQIEFYKNEVKILQQRYIDLTSDISVLIQTTHMGDIVFFKNQPVYIYSFFNNGNVSYLYNAIKEVDNIIKSKYKLHFNLGNNNQINFNLPQIVRISKENINEIYNQMKKRINKRLAFIFISKRNIFLGEYVDLSIYQIEDKILVKNNTVLDEVYIDEPENLEKNFTLIMKTLSNIQKRLISKGKLFLPQENSIGGKIPLEKIVTELIKIKDSSYLTKNKKKFKILLINKDDIYIAGKFEIILKTIEE